MLLDALMFLQNLTADERACEVRACVFDCIQDTDEAVVLQRHPIKDSDGEFSLVNGAADSFHGGTKNTNPVGRICSPSGIFAVWKLHAAEKLFFGVCFSKISRIARHISLNFSMPWTCLRCSPDSYEPLTSIALRMFTVHLILA